MWTCPGALASAAESAGTLRSCIVCFKLLSEGRAEIARNTVGSAVSVQHTCARADPPHGRKRTEIREGYRDTDECALQNA